MRTIDSMSGRGAEADGPGAWRDGCRLFACAQHTLNGACSATACSGAILNGYYLSISRRHQAALATIAGFPRDALEVNSAIRSNLRAWWRP